MNAALRPLPTFVIVCAISGFCSWLSVLFRPLGAFLPGLMFGIAIAFAVHHSIQPLSAIQHMMVVLWSAGGYLTAIVVTLLSFRLPGWTNTGFISQSVSGLLAGGIGAFVVAIGPILTVKQLRSFTLLGATAFAGATFGALVANLGPYLSDHPSIGHPIDDLVVFPLWQVGVGSTVATFSSRRKSGAGS